MPLQKQLMNVPMAGGLDQRTDPKTVQPGKLTGLVNGVFDKNGTIRKRRGNTALSSAVVGWPSATPGIISTIATPYRLASFGDELLAIDGHRLYTYSPNQSRWYVKDQVPEPLLQRDHITSNSSSVTQLDICYVNHFVVFAYNSGSTGLGFLNDTLVIVDSNTGAVIRTITLNSGNLANSTPKLFAIGNTLYVMYQNTAAHVVVQTLDLSVPYAAISPVPALIISDYSGASGSAIDVAVLGTDYYVVYNTAAQVKLAKFNSANVLQGSAVYGAAQSACSSVCSSAGSIWFAYTVPGVNTSVTTVNVSTSLVTASTHAAVCSSGSALDYDKLGLCSATLTTVLSTAVYLVATHPNGFTQSVTASGGTVNATYNFHILTKPFTYGGSLYVVGHYASTLQGTGYVCEIPFNIASAPTPMRVVGTFAPRTMLLAGAGTGDSVANVVTMSTGVWVAPTVTLRSATGINGLDQLTIDFTDGNRWQPQEFTESLLFSGGSPSFYDGSRLAEIGFYYYPETFITTPSNVGGAMGAGTYQYAVTYEWTDARGQRHRSAPSVAVSVTTTGAGTSSVAITALTMLSLSQKADYESSFLPTITACIYRTTVNGSIFYKISTDPTPFNSFTSTTYSSTYTDNRADTAISSNELLYTTGGVLNNVCPPSFSSTTIYKNRFWGVGDDGTIWYSKTQTPGEAIAFCDENTIPMGDGKRPTALAVLDDKLIIFKSDRIYVLVGDGPTDTGSGNDLSVPQLLISDVGCTEPRSVVTMPSGIMFLSAKGIYLLSRQLELTYEGMDVEDITTAYPYCTSATLMTTEQQVRFTMANGVSGGSRGYSVVYDYLQDSWCQFDYYDSVLLQNSAPVASACMSRGVYTWAGITGGIFTENPSGGDWLDAGHWVTLDIEGSWLAMSGLQGYQRVWTVSLLADRYSNHDVQIQLGTDFDTTYSQSVVFPASVTSDLTASEQVKVHVVNQKCQAIRVRITDATPTSGAVGTGQGLNVTGLALEIGTKQGSKKVPAFQRG